MPGKEIQRAVILDSSAGYGYTSKEKVWKGETFKERE
jgi:hypothetical protein